LYEGDYGYLIKTRQSVIFLNCVITRQQACDFILSYQELYPPRKLKGKEGILYYINKVGSIQFDPLNIIGRNPELVLQSRVHDYKPELLEELLYRDRLLLDGYDKEMCIYKIEDWPYFYRRRKSYADYLNTSKRGKPVLALHSEIVKEIEKRGPLSSKDLNLNQTVDWAWSPTTLSRAVLESLYNCGNLIIHHKEKTRKYYDLAYRHIPHHIFTKKDPNKTENEYHDWYVQRRIGSFGMVWNRSGPAWLGTCKSKQRNDALSRLIKKRLVKEINVKGITAPFYMRERDYLLLEEVITTRKNHTRSALIAPLDNMMWDRSMIEALFGFTYRWEVYKPAIEREYGYYVLPVLFDNKFVARCEPGIDNKKRALLIKQWWWEEGVRETGIMKKSITECFRDFLRFSGLQKIIISDEIKKKLSWLTE
jgi:uncharacterized protein YcaQ